MIPRKIHTNSLFPWSRTLGLYSDQAAKWARTHTRSLIWPECTYQLLWCFAVFGTEAIVDWWIILRNGSYNNSVLGRAREYPKVRGWFASQSSIYRSLVAGPWHSDHRGSVVIMCTRHMIEWGRCWLPHRPTNSSKVMTIRRRRRLLFVPCNQQRHLTIIRVIASETVCEEERRI